LQSDENKKIFILSLHRSGTQSTHQLLQNAGFNALHWPEIVGGVDYQAQVLGKETNLKAITKTLAPVIAQYDALSDAPIPVLYKELHKSYPDARFIALYRSPYDWLLSIRKHINTRELVAYEKVQYWHYLKNRPERICEVTDYELLEMHIQHHADLLRHFQGNPQFFLCHLIDETVGEKICHFLGVPPLAMPDIDYAREIK